MKGYILSIAGAVLLSALITILSPSGKMGKFLKGATKLVILFVMVSPLANFLTQGSFDWSAGEIGTDEAYLSYCADLAADGDEEAIAAYLAEEYGIEAAVTVTVRADETFSYEKITVEWENAGIFDRDEHIHISEEIESALKAKYGCEAEVI